MSAPHLCRCTDGGRQQPYIDCPDCDGTGMTTAQPESRGVRVNETHLETVFHALTHRAEQQERVTVWPTAPTVKLRVVRKQPDGGRQVLHIWEAR
ncbi:hypothetical protein GCM10008957_11000 [Deinococcus ruber]|uniref:Uncharacterized protein n=1 Tax=Deinococcus ruber TaxID=1848197 RepID=A0A918F1Y6_9DEIO|nr:hypothetical protein GCM10008957_11000 [Deinococcus ruber]